jgi:hypothetical protein
MISRASSLVILAATLGCTLNGPVIGQRAGTQPTREPVIAAEVTLEVMTKQEPDALIARDGSACRVSPDVYSSTRIGSMFRCRWVRNH